MPDIEPHVGVKISKAEAKKLLKKYKSAKVILWYSDFDKVDVGEGYFVISQNAITFDELSSNTRNQIRKAQKYCKTEIVDKKAIACDDGYEVFTKHNLRFSNHIISKELFYNQILNVDDNIEFYACFEKETGKLIGYMENKIGEAVGYSIIKTNTDYLKLYPNYAMFFNATNHYIAEGKLYVSDGFRSLDHHSNIQDLLIDKF